MAKFVLGGLDDDNLESAGSIVEDVCAKDDTGVVAAKLVHNIVQDHIGSKRGM